MMDSDGNPILENIFAMGAGIYRYASGAGAWSTNLNLERDGTFTGFYHDSNLGESREGYDGTVYQCEFYGRFKNPEMINEYTYEMELDYVELETREGEEVIRDFDGKNMRYVNTRPYGMDVGEKFYMYLPGAVISELSETFVNWVSMPNAWGNNFPETLPFYGIYNVEGGSGFFRVNDTETNESATTKEKDIEPQATVEFVPWEEAGLQDHVMDWGDEGLEAAMREITGISGRDLMLSDVWEITKIAELDFPSGNPCKDISALRELTNLTSLRLSQCQLSDVSALGSLSNLTELQLRLDRLDWLEIPGLDWEGQIDDISVLSELPNLKDLSLVFRNCHEIKCIISALG